MTEINRRDFVKNVGFGMGIAISSNVWLDRLFAGVLPENGQTDGEGFFGVSKEDMRKLLGIALSKGGDFSELFFEYRVASSVSMEEDILKSSSESIQLGVGVRVLNGEQTGYGYTNDLTFEKIKHAALTAAAIASGQSKLSIGGLNVIKPHHQVYDLGKPLSETNLNIKINLVREAYDACKAYDNRIVKVSSSIADEIQYVTIVNSDGLYITDMRPQARLTVSCTAEQGGVRGSGFATGGGRVGADFYNNVHPPKDIGRKSAEEAILLLSAKDAPAGEQTVVLSKDQSGIMVHEAVGHPLEADGNWKKTSIMSDKMGTEVANPLVTIYDDATIPNYRGSLNIDDEGTETENVMLIEKGRLVGYLNDRLGADVLKHKKNGHGRRQSYSNPPIPRMNNTVLARGESDPDDIIKSVKKGIYAVTYQGGMVNGTGKFTFSVNLGYMIEDGKLTYPVKNATLIGTNLQILKEIDMVGNDMGFFLGTCGKDGQSVPVTCGTPTLRIRKMTVGGIA